MLLRSGLQDKRASKATVSECNNKLEVEIAWLAIVPYTEELRKFWNKHEMTTPDHHSKIAGFHNFFQKTRKKGADPVFSHGEIELPFPVNETTKLKRVGGVSGSRVTHVELTTLENSDRLNQDKDDFDATRSLFFFCVCLCFV